jgi:alpha-L-rhamnosidase
MGMENWKGTWISDRNDINILPAPYFRKVFLLMANRLGPLGHILLQLVFTNSILTEERSGTTGLDPMYTRFDRRNLYVSYDVTGNLKAGKKCNRCATGQRLVQSPVIGSMEF